MKVLVSTNHCFSAVSKEEAIVVGDYSFLSNKGFKTEEINFDEFEWEAQREEFQMFLDEKIKKYEKQYKTLVSAIALVGQVGRWNGNFIGGRFIPLNDDPLDYMGDDIEDIEVKIADDGEILIYGHHHDGTHIMSIYLLTERMLERIAPNYLQYGEYSYTEMERIYKELKPLKITKKEMVSLNYLG